MSGAIQSAVGRSRWTGSIDDRNPLEMTQTINCRCVPIPGLSAEAIAEWERVLGGKVIK